MTTITALGATGRVGTLACREALVRGAQLRLLVRDPAGLPDDLSHHPLVTVVTAEVDDLPAAREAVTGADAVLVTLGLRYRGRTPWSRVRGRTDVVPAAVSTLVAAAEGSPSPPHVVMVSAVGAGDSWARLPAVARWVVRTSSLRIAFAGLTTAEQTLDASPLPHTLVRAVTLDDGPATDRPVDATGRALSGNPTLSRADLARFLVGLAVTPRPADRRRTVLVAA